MVGDSLGGIIDEGGDLFDEGIFFDRHLSDERGVLKDERSGLFDDSMHSLLSELYSSLSEYTDESGVLCDREIRKLVYTPRTTNLSEVDPYGKYSHVHWVSILK